MISSTVLSELLANLYAAPLEPQKWQPFFDRLCSLIDISSGYLVGSYATEGNVVLAGGGASFDPEVIALYNNRYGPNDPYQPQFAAKARIGFISGDELLNHDHLRQSELYNELLCRYDMEYMNSVCCNSAHGNIEVLSLWRSRKHGQLDASATSILESLTPHLQTALLLRKRLVAGDAASIFCETALEAMSIAAFLTNSKGQIMHMNRLASMHLEEGSCLRLVKGRLMADHPEAPSGRLEKLISQATATGSDYVPGGSMRLAHFNVTVVRAPEQNEIAGHELYAVVFITDTRKPVRSRTAVMRQLFGLTPSEARVTDRLLHGMELREIAESQGMTLETCRFHLKRVFVKTGTHRQVELIRLMLSLPG